MAKTRYVCQQISTKEESSKNKLPHCTESNTPQLSQETQINSKRCKIHPYQFRSQGKSFQKT